jgi:phosphotransferase system HPr-like phosphotransfer protein
MEMVVMQKETAIPKDFTERLVVEIVQGLSVMTGAPLYCIKNERRVNLNSILGLLSLNLKLGDKVIFETEDPKKLERIEQMLFFN